MPLKTRRTSKPHQSERAVCKTKFQADLAPSEELTLPRVEISWTQRELESLAILASKEPAAPTDALIRAMRG